MAILGLSLQYASRFLKWLKFLLKRHVWQIEEYSLMLNYQDYIEAKLWPYYGCVLDDFKVELIWNIFGYVRAIVGPIQGIFDSSY